MSAATVVTIQIHDEELQAVAIDGEIVARHQLDITDPEITYDAIEVMEVWSVEYLLVYAQEPIQMVLTYIAAAQTRLIDAAPDLLKTCEIVLASLRVDRGNCADIHLLEATIAKATT